MRRFRYVFLSVLIIAFCSLCIFFSLKRKRRFYDEAYYTHDGDVLIRDDNGHGGKLKIAVVMWWDVRIEAYAELAWKINCAYGLHHGIDVIRSSKKRDARSAMWQRMKLMQDYLDGYDYVMWCDADAAFNFQSQSLKTFIHSHGYPDSILSEDHPNSWNSYKDGKMIYLSHSELKDSNLNSGVVIVRNSPAGRRLLQLWDLSEGFTHNDQSPLRYIYHTYHNGSDSGLGRIVKVPYGVLQVFPDDIAEAMDSPRSEPLVFHMAGKTFRQRVNFFSELLPMSVQALNQTLFYLDPLVSTNQYDRELRSAFEASWRRVKSPDDADVTILLMSDERNYPNFTMDGGSGMTIVPRNYVQNQQDASGVAFLTFDLTSSFELPENAINVAFSNARGTDIVAAPPALKGRSILADDPVDRPILASFKGRQSRLNRSGEDVRAQSFEALQTLHDGVEVIICDNADSRYDYDDLLKKSKFAFILEGDLPWTYRLTEAIFLGCVPFFIQKDFLTLPHSDLVDWDEMCLRLPLDRTMEARSVAEAALGNVPRMQAALRRYCSERLQTRALEAEAILATHSLRYGIAGRVRALTDLLQRLPPIPKKIHLTWKDKNVLHDKNAAKFSIVKYGVQALRDVNPTWSLEISDDADVETYLQRHLEEEDYALIKGKHIVEKTDLWHLLKIYHEGGCYCDVDRLHNRSLDASLHQHTKVCLPTYEDVNCAQDLMISTPGAPHLRHAIELNLKGRREGRKLYDLGPVSYWEATSHFVLGFPILHEGASPYIFSKFRSIIDACPYMQTFREEPPFNTFTYRGPKLDLDKADFYEAFSVKHW